MCLNVEIRTLHEFYVPLMVRILTWISKFNSLIMAGKSVKDWLGSTNPDVRLLRISTINCKNTCMYNTSTHSLSLNYNPFFFSFTFKRTVCFYSSCSVTGSHREEEGGFTLSQHLSLTVTTLTHCRLPEQVGVFGL